MVEELKSRLFGVALFTAGTYNMTLIITDIGGNTASDSILVTIILSTITTISIVLLFSAAGAVLVIVFVFIRFKKSN